VTGYIIFMVSYLLYGIGVCLNTPELKVAATFPRRQAEGETGKLRSMNNFASWSLRLPSKI